jgi:hypothetical protein
MFFPVLFHLLGTPLSIGLIMANLRMDIRYWPFCLATHSAFDAHLTPPEGIPLQRTTLCGFHALVEHLIAAYAEYGTL